MPANTHFLPTGSSPRPAVVQLRAGPLTAEFEPDIAFLRHIRLGDHEVVRAIYGAVRNHEWKTVALGLQNMQIEVRDQSFHITFDADCHEGDLNFFWRGEIIGTETGLITYTFDGEARSNFLKNRIGLCVLHPIPECAGREMEIEFDDGQRASSFFPKAIHAFQPFSQIRRITHGVVAGARSEVCFGGDVFEMEDQRNYSDMSFKIYSTSVKLPFPTLMETGSQVHQKVTVTPQISGQPILPVVQGRQAQLSIATTLILPKPAIGLSLSLAHPVLSPVEIKRLRALQLSHLRVDLRLGFPEWEADLHRGLEAVAQLGIQLNLGLFFTQNQDQELAALKLVLARSRPSVALWLLLHTHERVTPRPLVESFYNLLTELALPAFVAAGTHGHYVDLTQSLPSTLLTTSPCFPINPQVHAFDTTTMIENVATVAEMVESAPAFSVQPVVISPITLKPFSNAQPPVPGEIPADLDSRQSSLFGAAWTVASLARLVGIKNVHSLTYFETVGVRGVMEALSGTQWPSLFPSIPGAVYPLYHVLADLAGFTRILPTSSTLPLHLDGFSLTNESGQQRVVLANLLPDSQTIKIKTGTQSVRVRLMDEDTILMAQERPEEFRELSNLTLDSMGGKIELTLKPYAVVCMDYL